MISFIIGFIVGAMLMMCSIGMVAIQKDKKPRNKVRFFVEKEISNSYFLYIENKGGMCYICSNNFFKKFGLNPDDFADMKEGQLREVFINLEE